MNRAPLVLLAAVLSHAGVGFAQDAPPKGNPTAEDAKKAASPKETPSADETKETPQAGAAADTTEPEQQRLSPPTGSSGPPPRRAATVSVSRNDGDHRQPDTYRLPSGNKRSPKQRGAKRLRLQPPAQAPREEAPPEPPGLGTYQRHAEVTLGFRANWIGDEGYKQFSDNAFLPQLTLGLGYAFLQAGSLSIAAHGFWEYGKSGSTLRGPETTLETNRLSLGASVRYHFLRQLFAFARVMPGARQSSTVLTEGSDTQFSAEQWAFSMDLSAGVQVQLLGPQRNDSHKPRWWLAVEGGYGIGTASDVELVAGDGAPERTAPVVLEPMELGGGLFRMSTSLTF